MILAIDIGNTNIVIGIFKDNKLLHQWRIKSEIDKSSDDYAIDMVELFLTNKINCLNISGVIISSVVPRITNIIADCVKKFCASAISNNLLIVGEKNVNVKVDIKTKNKLEVGHDRIVNSFIAHKKYQKDLIIIDLGTATTFDIVSKNCEFIGGIIAPGINLSIKALYDMTAQLPKITLKKQQNIIGTTTIEAMNSGMYHGYICLIEGLVKKIEKEYGHKTIKIMTGGLAEIFKNDLSNIIDHYEPNLTLEGLHKIYLQNS